MNTSLYTATVPVLKKNLLTLSTLLDKAAAHSKATGEDEAAFLQKHLIADMFTLVKQVQSTCDQAKSFAARITGATPVVFPDTETAIAPLKERITKVIAILDALKPEDVNGQEDRHITLPYFDGKYFTGHEYAFEFLMPNFFFHFTTAYDIMRANGMQIGKADFLGSLPLKDEAAGAA